MRPGSTLILLPLVWVILPGCSRLTPEQSQWLHEAQVAYDSKQYSLTVEHTSRFLEQVLDEPETVRALYYKGLAEAYLGQREAACQDLGHAVTLTGYPELRWRAHAALGTLHFEEEDWGAAADQFALAAAGMPKLPPRDVVLYRQGLALERAGRWSDAQAAYEQLFREFPESNIARAAQRRISAHTEHYAVNCGEFAVPMNADNFMFDLQRQGLEPYLYKEPRGNKTVYVVLIGRFQTREAAELAAERLRELTPDASVWP